MGTQQTFGIVLSEHTFHTLKNMKSAIFWIFLVSISKCSARPNFWSSIWSFGEQVVDTVQETAQDLTSLWVDEDTNDQATDFSEDETDDNSDPDANDNDDNYLNEIGRNLLDAGNQILENTHTVVENVWDKIETVIDNAVENEENQRKFENMMENVDQSIEYSIDTFQNTLNENLRIGIDLQKIEEDLKNLAKDVMENVVGTLENKNQNNDDINDYYSYSSGSGEEDGEHINFVDQVFGVVIPDHDTAENSGDGSGDGSGSTINMSEQAGKVLDIFENLFDGFWADLREIVNEM